MLQTQTTQNDEPIGPFLVGSANATHVSHSKNALKMSTLTACQLRERGWTKRMLDRFLVKPDGYAQNPHILTGRPMRLYRTDRLQEAESHDDFTGCLVAAKVLSARFADLYKLKTDALCLIADGIDINILELDRQTLTRNTYEEYGMFMRECARSS